MIKDELSSLYRGGEKGWLMNPAEKFALEACILEAGDGDYLEIGVNRGGSLSFAMLLKRHFRQKGKVYGIEAAIGYKEGIDKLVVGLGFGGDNYSVVYKKSDPWPADDELAPVVAFIDGDHTGETPLNDWNNLKDRVKRFIIFHDCDDGSPAVQSAVENAKTDGAWKFVAMSGCAAVFERK